MRFGEKARQYRQKATIQREVADWSADWLEAEGSGLRAIEFGAGSGLFTERLLEAGFNNLVASDLSARMVEEGRRVLPQAEWRMYDAWRECPGSFDRVYSCSLLQWAKDPVEVLKQWRRCLNPGGKILVSFFVEGSLREFIEGDSEFGAVKFRPCENWLGNFDAAGFKVGRWEEMERTLSYGSALEGLHSLHDIGAVEEGRKSAGKLRSFLKERDEMYRDRGDFPLTWKAMKVEATVSV